jgi:hypothetical protein
MMNTLFRTLVALLALGTGTGVARAQNGREAHPDWTGYYTLASNRELAGTGFKQDARGEQLNDLTTPHLQPWAK